MKEQSFLVVLPMHREMVAFSKGMSSNGYQGQETVAGRLPILVYQDLSLVAAVGGTGKAQFALQTQHLLDSGIEPDLVICAGAAGSLVDRLPIGDIVVGEATVEHDIREGFIEAPLPRFDANPAVLDALAAVSSSMLAFSIHKGIIASGDEDIVSKERRMTLRETTGAIAAAWEGAGGARACRFSGVDFVEIRGITDDADAGAANDFEVNLDIAMKHLATFLIAWIQSTYSSRAG